MNRRILTAAALAAAFWMGGGHATALASVGWTPTNTVVQVTGSISLRDNVGNTYSCSSMSNGTTNTYIEAPSSNPSVAHTVNQAGSAAPPVFGGCGSGTALTSSTSWNLAIVTTTDVDASNVTLKVNLNSGICVISAGSSTSPVSIPGNTWSNANHTLTWNSASSFPISESGLCDGGTSATLSGTWTFNLSIG